MEYGSPTFEDSLVVDTITVIADVVGHAGQTSSATATLCIGDCPEDCPSGWPVASGYVTQGPDSSYSHSLVEAIDIGTSGQPLPVYATHRGTVEYPSNPGCEGQVVHVRSICNGTPFVSRYSHLGSRTLAPGTTVSRGDQIGTVDNTGTCTGSTHLHYEFRGLLMQQPWIPEAILPSPSCCNNCGISCTNTIP